MEHKNQYELGFLMVKPDGVQRRIVGQILQRIEEAHLRLVALKFLKPSARLAASHYKQKRNGSSGLTARQAVEYLTSGEVLASVWKGQNAIRKLRKIVGSKTNPYSCRKGTIRRDFAADSIDQAVKESRAVRNVVHSSNNYQSAIHEINLWFGKRRRKTP